MTLKEIADALSIHESTVSRAVNGKYLETTFGVFGCAHSSQQVFFHQKKMARMSQQRWLKATTKIN